MKTNIAQQNILSGWQSILVDDICHVMKGQGLSKKDIDPSGKNKCLLYGELFTNYDEVIENVKSRTNSNVGIPSVNGDILIPGSTTTVARDLAVASALDEDGVLLGGDINILRKKDNFYDSKFLAYYLTHYKKDEIGKLGQGTTIVHLYGSNIKNLELVIPKDIKEQQKIAKILGTVDEDIAKTQQVIGATQKLKRGLMQQLLVRGIGHTKFEETKIGQIPEEWEVGELGSYLLRNPDYGINAAGVDYTEELPTYIRITDISDDGKFISENKKSVDHKDSGNYLLQEGDLLFARTGASVGKTYLYNPGDGKLIFAGFLIRVRTNEEKLLAKYLSYFVQTPMYWDWVRVMSTRSGQPGINGNEYAGMVIPVPKLSEQKRCIEILSAVDEKISVNKKLKGKLTLLKKGLMQDLLSGKVRVT